MPDPHAALAGALKAAVLDSEGTLDRAQRHAAAGESGPLPADLALLATKVREEAYAVEDGDLARLQRAGHKDDALFEVVLAAAVGAGMSRLERALAVIGGK